MRDPTSHRALRYFRSQRGRHAARVAATDLALAKKLLDRFKPDNTFYPHEARLRIAFAVAREKPDEALALVNSVKDGPYRVLGLVRLAVIFAPADKARAVKTIDAAIRDSVIWDDVTIDDGASLYRTIIADGVSIESGEQFENAAIVRADMVRNCEEIPEKALKGYIQGENYIVPLN